MQKHETVTKWRRGDSNSRPLHCERSALPAELRPLLDGWEISAGTGGIQGALGAADERARLRVAVGMAGPQSIPLVRRRQGPVTESGDC